MILKESLHFVQMAIYDLPSMLFYGEAWGGGIDGALSPIYQSLHHKL